jgi:hypothetical protein
MKDLLSNLKENNQDFEFYPTNSRMIATICNYFGRQLKGKTILDIGAGNGNFFTKLEIEMKKVMDIAIQNGADKRDINFWIHKFAIEKSQILIDAMPSDIIVVGADFYEQTLFDKEFDYIFCNPPYSQFKDWMHKIIKETNCNNVIMIMPSRWQDDKALVELVEKRGFTYKILAKDDFLDGERQARAYVDIIVFSRSKRNNNEYGYDHEIPQSFINFFEEEFISNFTAEKDQKIDDRLKDATENELVPAGNLVETMVNLYTLERNNLIDSYKAITKLSERTLRDIGVDKVNLINSLWYKITRLKKEYWQHLIHHTDKITDRLIKNVREDLLSSMSMSGRNDIDFNHGNIYAVIIWIIKNANKSYDQQLLRMFDICIAPENIKNYKSNQKVFETEENRWGHGCGTKQFKNEKEVSNVVLDYRIITRKNQYGHNSWLGSSVEDFVIEDWEIICNNLLGHKNFGDIKFFKNGNCHIKFNVEFAKAFNIQASLLKGWIKDKRQAKEEFEMDITEEDLNFSNFQINKNHFLLLD